MSWHDSCHDFNSRIEASAKDASFNDISFLLTQEDAEDSSGDKVFANKAILALVSPVFYSQFYGSPTVKVRGKKPIKIEAGTARGFKKMIKYICCPNSFRGFNSAEEVFETCYFAHRYQIGTLVSFCRSFLGSYGQDGDRSCFKNEKALEILSWAVSKTQLQNAFPAEHALLVQACWHKIETNFKDVFPNGEMKNDQPLPEEDLMIKIFGNKNLNIDEGLVLSVALDYFQKLIELEGNVYVCTATKKFKIDEESQWNEKMDKIDPTIKFKNVSPRRVSNILEKFRNKIPEKLVFSIMMKVSSEWKGCTSFEEKIRATSDKTIINFDINANRDKFYDDYELQAIDVAGKEIDIKFKINQNAILRLDLDEHSFLNLDDFETTFDYVSFQNEEDYEEVFREVWNEKKFFAKKNTDITIKFKTLSNTTEKVKMCVVRDFVYSQNDFQLEILQLNGEPVPINSDCRSAFWSLEFLPVKNLMQET